VQKYEIPDWYVDGQNTWYVPGKFLDVGVGNNSFSLPKKSDRNPLEITPLRVGSLDDLRLGKHVAFQDLDYSETPSPTPDPLQGEKNTPPVSEKWIECVGLESAILCLDFPIPIYVFDNHNHVFYAWVEALKMGWFEKGATLVHMDEHFDAGEALLPPDPLTPLQGGTETTEQSLEKIWRYTNEVLQIATYIKPALKLGMFSECIDYVESKHFEIPMRPPNPLERGNHLPSQNVVINLDIDVFHADMSHISWDQKIEVLKQYLPQTKLITMATSPYFIDQEKAIQLVKRVVQELF
jgi:hypothetical protein